MRTSLPPGTTVLDFVRYHQFLTGTKIGCREGDCGACTVLVGDRSTGSLRYRTATSCLMPLGNAQGKHIVTIEGINMDELNPIQQAMADESATQCGFCTPGFVMSLAGFCLSSKDASLANAVAAIDGNICRCTGYKSIERAAERVVELVRTRQADEDPAQYVANRGILPGYFARINERLQALNLLPNGELDQDEPLAYRVGGGTDVYVQKHDEVKDAPIRFLADKADMQGIWQDRSQCWIGPSTTVSDLIESPVIQRYFPAMKTYTKLVSSTPIRHMATLGGNFINASPIGDFTIIFLALDAFLTLSDGSQTRELPLRDLYLGYKTLNKRPEEYVVHIGFNLPGPSTRFNFEKVSKRTHLDIASVNSAIQLTVEGDTISSVNLSAGGVAPVPKRLTNTEAFLTGQQLREAVILEAVHIAQTDITPISDARGTEAYKRLLLGQLIKAHFIRLFPTLKADLLLMP